MELFEAIEKRRSIRNYRSDPVEPGQIERLLEAARLAPSASNTQTWRFKVVTDAGDRAKLRAAAYGQRFVEQAPAVIACCIDWDAYGEKGKRTRELVMRGVRPSMAMILRSVKGGADREFDPERVVINATINVAIAVEHIALAATAIGLGTCWIRAFEEDRVESILGLPEGVSVLCLITVGYPDETPSARPRRALEEIVIH